jgi:hypothetical protein
MRQSNFRRAALAGGLSIVCGAALADGSGTLNDSTLSLSYTSEPYVMANQVSFRTGTHICEEAPPTCDVYTLTVEISDAFRSNPANANAYIEVLVSSAGDFDLYVFDSSGTQIAAGENSGDEYLELYPDELPNGTYTLWLVPYTAAADTVDLGIAVKGTESKSGLAAVFGGGLAPALLLPFALLALRRRR